jgi:hypothetical protein
MADKHLKTIVVNANTNVVTQINVFIVPEGGQQALIDFLKEAAQLRVQLQVGFPPACIAVAMERGSSTMLKAKTSKLHSASSSVFERAVGWNEINLLARRTPDCTTSYSRSKNRPREIQVRSLKKDRTGFGTAVH